MTSNNTRKPDLYFSSSGTNEGFTSAGVQGFNDLNPTAIVRELIQNSLDAAREAGSNQAIIRFEVKKTDLNEIPAIDTYRKAFLKAEKDQSKLNQGLSDQAKMVTDTIKNCLNESEVSTLFVLDNGVGLDNMRMNALLGDGVSAKSSAGAGAVGNGHLTAIPASDLRYVLYGGLNDDKKIASGHAVLASFEDDKEEMRSKDGYFVLSINCKINNPHDYPQGNIPSFINDKLNWIKEKYKRGTVVALPAFNRFKENGMDLWDTIKNSAACNFFLAIAGGGLKVEYCDDSGEKKLDKDNIDKVFGNGLANEKRARRARKFLSGSRAAEAYTTGVKGKKHEVDVGCGQVTVYIRELTGGGISRIDLCRNGMWITDDLPRLSPNSFRDKKPFHCLITVDASDGDIHRLIRKSEGPLHNHIESQKWLLDDEKKTLRNAFGKISDYLKNNLEKLQEESFRVSNFLSVVSEEGAVGGGRRSGIVGKFEQVTRRRPRTSSVGGSTAGGTGGGGGSRRGGKNGGGGSGNAFRRTGNPMEFGAVMVPTNSRSYQVKLMPKGRVKKGLYAEIRFVLDESIDETCDLTSDEQFVKLDNVMLNSKLVPQNNLIKSEKNDVLGIRLDNFDEDQQFNLSFDYELPDGVTVKQKDKVVLRAEIVQRKVT